MCGCTFFGICVCVVAFWGCVVLCCSGLFGLILEWMGRSAGGKGWVLFSGDEGAWEAVEV